MSCNRMQQLDKVKKMKWEKHTKYEPIHGSEFDVTHYRSGIYKLSCYKFFRNQRCVPYWQAYLVAERARNWGDYLYPSEQRNAVMTLKEAKKLCERHSKTYKPSANQVKTADRAWHSWVNKEVAA